MAILSEINAFFSLKDRFWKAPANEPEAHNTAKRFIRLFEGHGVARAQIPRFFGHGLNLYQVENEAELLKALNQDILQAAAELFGIKLEWLEGATDELYELNNFYKAPRQFGIWLDQLLATSVNADVDGWLLTTHVSGDQYDALILMRERIGELSSQPIYRYHFCELWIYSYWKCRADLAACIAQAWKRNCYIYGRELKVNVFEKLASLTAIPDAECEGTEIRGRHFHPENLATEPQDFVNGLAEGSFGKTAAIRRWLEHDKQALMDAGFGDHSNKFESMLHKIVPED